MNCSGRPAARHFFWSASLHVGHVKSRILFTVPMPTTIDSGTRLIHGKVLNCTSPTMWIKSLSAEPFSK